LSKAYQQSVKEVAHNYAISYQTIADGCRRRLHLKDANQFLELLTEWLSGNPDRLRDLLIEHSGETERYKIGNFFNRAQGASPQLSIPKNLDDQFELVSIRIPQNIAFQMRTLAESRKESFQDFSNRIIKEHVEHDYVEYLKSFLNSLPQNQKKQILTELTKNLATN
jgi:hypothetical protein